MRNMWRSYKIFPLFSKDPFAILECSICCFYKETFYSYHNLLTKITLFKQGYFHFNVLITYFPLNSFLYFFWSPYIFHKF